jgi:hypothetical protein
MISREFRLADTYCYTTSLSQAQLHAVERQLRSLQEERQSTNINSKPASVQQQLNHALKAEPAKHTITATTTATKPDVHIVMTDTSKKTVSKTVALFNNTPVIPVPVPLSKPTYTATVTPSVDHLDLKRVGKRADSGNDSSTISSSDSHHGSDKAVAVHNDSHHDRVQHAVSQVSTAVAQQQPTTATAAHTTPQRSAVSWVKDLWNRAKPSSSGQHHGDSKTAAARTLTSSDKSNPSDIARFSSSRTTATVGGSVDSGGGDTNVDLEFFGVGG